MSIYSRSYMQHNFQNNQEPWALKSILISIIAIFLIQNVARHWFGLMIIEDLFALSIDNLSKGFVHTLLTYGFLHSTDGALPWHLVFNSLMLWWFGKDIENHLGSKKFLECFVFSVFFGGLLWTTLHLLSGTSSGVVGASGGVFGILYLFCKERWRTEMGFLLLPLRFTGQQLFYVLLGFQLFFLLFAEIPGIGSTTAHSAHLGGFLGAWIYERFLLNKRPIIDSVTSAKTEIKQPAWKKKVSAVQTATGNKYTVNFSDKSGLKSEIDRILDKINDKGFGSLSEEEKKTLDRAKDILK